MSLYRKRLLFTAHRLYLLRYFAQRQERGYGLICVCGREAACFDGAADDRTAADRLLSRLCRQAVFPVHLRDVIGDLAAEGRLSEPDSANV